MKRIALDVLDESSNDDNEDGFRIFDDARDTHAGGAGTARLDRAAPRPFIPAAMGYPRFAVILEWTAIKGDFFCTGNCFWLSRLG